MAGKFFLCLAAPVKIARANALLRVARSARPLVYLGSVTTGVQRKEKINLLKASIDEFTLVLQAPVDVKLGFCNQNDWINYAESIIVDFEKIAQLDKVLGLKSNADNLPAGYTNGYTFGQHSFYFAIAYNPQRYSMGVVVKFSAESLHYYLGKANCEAYEFLQLVQSPAYEMRLSRIDLDIDFVDERFTVNGIYQRLKSKKTEVFLQKQRQGKTIFAKKPLHYRGFMKSGKIQTIYINSPKSSVNCRIYNKCLEEIELNKADIDYALEHKWCRFEVVFKNEYAHNLTSKLLQIHSKRELYDLILNCWLQKFYFKNADGHTAVYTQKMVDALKDSNFKLMGQIPKDNDLIKRFKYLLENSGTISTLYKIKLLWGSEALAKAVAYINNYTNNWTENDGCKAWIKLHAADTKDTFEDYTDFIANFK